MYHILLVDNEPMIKMGIRKLLENTEYHIAGTSSNGEQALAFLEANPVDIVITDLKMPIMDGIDLIKRLKSLNFSGVTLALSNYSDFELVRQALTEGAADYILKTDITRERLLEHLLKIKQLIQTQESQRIESTRREEQLRKSQKQLLLSELKEAIVAGAGASTSAQALLPRSMPVGIILISLLGEGFPEERLKHILTKLDTILQSFFSNVEILLFHTKQHEGLYVIPQPQDMDTLLVKVQQLQRQITIYLNLFPDLSYGVCRATTLQLHEQYLGCEAALKYRFYSPDTHIFPVKDFPPFLPSDSELLDSFL